MQQITTLERMGENLGICIPANILHKAQLDVKDKLFFDVDDKKGLS